MGVMPNASALFPKGSSYLLRAVLACGVCVVVGVGEVRAAQGEVPRMECDVLYGLMQAGKAPVVVDVRAPADFEEAHIPGAVSAPFYKLPKDARWPKERSLVLYCAGKGCPLSYDSALSLLKAGYKNVKVLNGGIREWELREYPVVRAVSNSAAAAQLRHDTVFSGMEVAPRKLADYLGAGGLEVVIMDTRPENEFEAAHIPGAKNFPLEQLADRLKELAPEAEIVVCDGSVERARAAVAALNAAGFPAHYLAGGMLVWSAAGHPVAAGKGL